MMNRITLYHFLLFALILTGCSKSNDSFGQEAYRGGKKHAQPGMDSFPAAAGYDPKTAVIGALKDSLDKTTADLFRLPGIPGMTAAVLIPGKGLWQTDTGFIGKPEGKKADSSTVFYWASVTKLLTATIISQLIQEGKLNADSKLAGWFPQFQHAGEITLNDLLLHTSGIYNFNNDPAKFSIDHYYTPAELVSLAAAQHNLFPHGQYWSYSNTNYLLLALIAEKTEGKAFSRIVHDRIAGPLNLPSLRVLEPREHPSNLALAHAGGKIVTEDYSVPLGAGDVTASAKDMVIFLYSLMTGKLGPVPAFYNRLKDLYPMPDKGTYYGSGIMLTDFSEINGTGDLWIGHSGGTETYRALLVYDTAKKTFIALAVNQHISVEACALKLLTQIKP